MNLLFPNFNFSEWMTDFHLTSLFLDSKKIDDDKVLMEKEMFLESLENFEYQIHLNVEDENSTCSTCNFLKVLNDFTAFMALISSKFTEKIDVVEFFLKHDYPSNKNHRAIAKALLLKINGYNSVDKNGITQYFPSAIITNIDNFLKRHNINLK